MRSAAIVLAAAIACSPRTEQVRVPSNGARTMIVAHASGGRIERAFAVEIDPASAFYSFPLPLADPAEVYALHYDCALQELRVPEGELQISMTGRGLPFSEAISSARISDRRASAFADLESVPEVIREARFELPAYDPCGDWIEQEWTLPDTKPALEGAFIQPSFILPLDEERALIAVAPPARYFIVHKIEGPREISGASTEAGLGAHRASAGAGRINLVQTDGYLSFATAEALEFLPPPRAPRTQHLQMRSSTTTPVRSRVWLTGAPAGDAPELFVLSEFGKVEYFDSTVQLDNGEVGIWRELGAAAATSSLHEKRSGGLIWLEPGRALAAGRSGEEIEVFSRMGTREKEHIDGMLDADLPISVVSIGGRVLIGTLRGGLYQRTGRDQYRELYEPMAGNPSARVILPLDEGFFFGGESGLFCRTDGCGPCEPLESYQQEISQAAMLGDDMMFASANEEGSAARQDNIHVVVRRRSGLPQCMLPPFGDP